MNRDHAKGMFFVFEGPNGSGKTTAMRTVAERMRSLGADVITTREPGGSETAEKIRSLLLDPSIPMDPHEQTLLFMAARRNHIRTVIRPAMERGAIVLCDRFVASTMVYQTLRPEGGPPLSTSEVVAAHEQWCWGMAPDMQFHLHLPVAVAAGRRSGRAAVDDRYESDDMAYEQACADRYAESGRLLGFRQHDIQADGSPEQTVERLMGVMHRVAEDRLWSIVVHRVGADRTGRWYPVTDRGGRVWWTHEPSEAHRRAMDEHARDGGAQIRFVRRSAAVAAIDSGMTTCETEAASRGI